MAEGRQAATYSTNLEGKLELRRNGTAAIGGLSDEARIWLPCAGKGDLAGAMIDEGLWSIDRIDPIDKDAAAKRMWEKRFPGSKCRVLDAAKWKPPTSNPVYAVADIDAFGQPISMAATFLNRATWTKPALLVLTDGLGQLRLRRKQVFDFNTHRMAEIDSERCLEQHEEWPKHATEWVNSHPRVESARLLGSHRGGAGTQKTMWYVAIILDDPADRIEPEDISAEQFRKWTFKRLRAENAGDNLGVDGLLPDGGLLLVRRRRKVGRPVVDELTVAVQRANVARGVVAALSFTEDARQAVADAKGRGLAVELATPTDLETDPRQPTAAPVEVEDVPAAEDIDLAADIRGAYWRARNRERAIHQSLLDALKGSTDVNVGETRKALVDALDEMDRLRPAVAKQQSPAAGAPAARAGGIPMKFPRVVGREGGR